MEIEEEPAIYVKVLLRRPWHHWQRFRLRREADVISLNFWNVDTGHWKRLFAHSELKKVKSHLYILCPQISWHILRNLKLEGTSLVSFRSLW